jgi:hypothetical protein
MILEFVAGAPIALRRALADTDDMMVRRGTLITRLMMRTGPTAHRVPRVPATRARSLAAFGLPQFHRDEPTRR